jgi:hypothetical protein
MPSVLLSGLAQEIVAITQHHSPVGTFLSATKFWNAFRLSGMVLTGPAGTGETFCARRVHQMTVTVDEAGK